MVTLWHIWNWRNRNLHCEDTHDREKVIQEDLFPIVQCQAALWFFNRGKAGSFGWDIWLSHPLDCFGS